VAGIAAIVLAIILWLANPGSSLTGPPSSQALLALLTLKSTTEYFVHGAAGAVVALAIVAALMVRFHDSWRRRAVWAIVILEALSVGLSALLYVSVFHLGTGTWLGWANAVVRILGTVAFLAGFVLLGVVIISVVIRHSLGMERDTGPQRESASDNGMALVGSED